MKKNSLPPKICGYCGKEFKHNKSKAPGKKYCGRKCAKLAQKVRSQSKLKPEKEIKCNICGNIFYTKTYNAKLCSQPCRNLYYLIKEPPAWVKHRSFLCECAWCGSKFEAPKSNAKYCTKECRDKEHNKKVERLCYECGCTVNIRLQYSKNKKDDEISCRKCISKKNKMRSMMPTVTPEILNRNKAVFGKELNYWLLDGFGTGASQKIMDRDGWKCYICGKEKNLHVHHIIPRNRGGEHTPENLITLCGSCHRNIESGDVDKAIRACTRRALNNIK